MQTSKNKIVKNVSMLYLLNIAKMVFPLVTLPYLTRVLSVETYGVVSYVKATMQYMQLMVDFGFMLSGTKAIVLVLGKQDEINREIGNIFVARLILCLFAFVILIAAMIFIPILNQNMLYTVLSFVTVFLTVFLMDFYFRGIEKMEIITIRFVVMRGIATLLTFVVVRSDADILWIPILNIIGSMVAIVLVWIQLKKLNVKICPDGLRSAVKKLKDSAVYFVSNMATSAFGALNTLLIGVFIDPVNVAYWSVCAQIIGAVQSFYTPITSGIYPQMVLTKKRSIIQKTVKIFLPIIAVGCIFTFFVAKEALLIVGGVKYTEASYLLRLLTPVMFFGFLSMIYGWPTLGAINKQKQVTVTTVTAATFQVFALLVLIGLNCFNLIAIAIVRCITEFILFATRFGVYWKNRREFV